MARNDGVDIAGTVRERAARELRDRILTGALPAGTRLDLDAITKEFATSRTPVREALLELSYDGLVRVAPRSGITVIGMSPEDVLDSFTILGVLTGQAAAWAAERVSDDGIERLRTLATEVDRTRRELECANSSDALLMNIFCYPGMLRRASLCSLLGIEPGIPPMFGFRPGIPLKNGAQDRSEMDLKLGALLVEAKLTEGDFQSSRQDLVDRYRDLESVFDVDRLPRNKQRFRSCQLIRGALAAHAHAASFAVFCDQRRQDLIEDCFEVMSAVVSAELRCRMSVVTWQELASAMPHKVRTFLAEKYGIS